MNGYDNRSLTETDKQRCVLDIAYRQVNDLMLDRKEVCVMLDIELDEYDLPKRYQKPTLAKLDPAERKKTNSEFSFHVRLHDET